MKSRIISTCIVLCMILPANAQILDNLKEAITGGTSKTVEENTADQINTATKRDFYQEDIVIETYDVEKKAKTVNYFDADHLAMKSVWKDHKTGKVQKSFIDSEGYFIAYDDNEGCFVKTNLLSNGAIAMIGPSAMAQAYKLPVGAIWEASDQLNKKGLKLNTFMFVEFAFILKPDHFRTDTDDTSYTEKTVACRGSSNCTKFVIDAEGYSNSFILFDGDDRLAEINITAKNQQQFGSGSGQLEYFYKPCEVNLPAAKEKKMPGQDLFNLGLDPNKN
ncbi:MAG: hypothetical protein HKN96_06120 [Flavobacteriaceae bacterium]|nr:hypothetical protein [Flavobacteriaceae bacterium]NND26673.1 hypothetical protein [Flavobacteriaceae bacterium]NNF86258.1 hypothetical protein [Winogradskyella sp.]